MTAALRKRKQPHAPDVEISGPTEQCIVPVPSLRRFRTVLIPADGALGSQRKSIQNCCHRRCGDGRHWRRGRRDVRVARSARGKQLFWRSKNAGRMAGDPFCVCAGRCGVVASMLPAARAPAWMSCKLCDPDDSSHLPGCSVRRRVPHREPQAKGGKDDSSARSATLCRIAEVSHAPPSLRSYSSHQLRCRTTSFYGVLHSGARFPLTTVNDAGAS